jgi:hypothetical protein
VGAASVNLRDTVDAARHAAGLDHRVTEHAVEHCNRKRERMREGERDREEKREPEIRGR